MTAKDNLPAEVADKTSASSDLPAYLQGGDYTPQDDNFGTDDVVIPRIKLLQGTSPEVEKYDHAKIGHFWHTGMDISLGESFIFVAADRRKKYLLSAPLEDGQGILARGDDAVNWDRTGEWQVKLKGVKKPVTWTITDLNIEKSGMANWGTSNPEDEDSGPAATLFYDYLVFLPDHLDLGPAIVSLARASVKKARKGLNDKIKLQADNGRPMQALRFEASSVSETSDSGEFKNWSFTSGGFNMDEELFNMAREHIGALSMVKIQDETATDDKASAPVDSGEGNY